MRSFSAIDRQSLIKQLQDETFDLTVIGGGITGAGIALDAAARGLKVALVEMQDFAGGTSSRSTRLIHGGLRYLKQGEFKLVAEVGRERKIIYRNAPHLVKPELLLLPITKTGSFGKLMTRLAMLVYETLAGVKKEERHKFLNAQEALKLEPLLKKENLLGGILYYEYRTDDARLTLTILKESVKRGALALSYMKVTGFVYKSGIISGVKVEDRLGPGTFNVSSRYVINASGPWVDDLDSLDNDRHGNKLQLTKGVHLVTDHKLLPLKQAVYFDSHDKRMIFALPHRGKTYIGTTDTFFDGDKVDPKVTSEDKDYLLKCVNDYFAGPPLKRSHIQSSWAGLRPLLKKAGKKPSEISRRDETFLWESGLISIAGGKLTGYRRMARRVVDMVSEKIKSESQKQIPACSTETIILSGGQTGSLFFKDFSQKIIAEAVSMGLGEGEASNLVNRYGSGADQLLQIVEGLKRKKETGDEFPVLLRAELIYAIENEMCLTPCDFFVRRTGMLYFDIDSVKHYKVHVLHLMQSMLNWDKEDTERHGRDLEAVLLAAQGES